MKRKFDPSMIFDIMFGLFAALGIMCFLVCFIMTFMSIGNPIQIPVDGVSYNMEVWWIFLLAAISSLISFGFLAAICYAISHIIERLERMESKLPEETQEELNEKVYAAEIKIENKKEKTSETKPRTKISEEKPKTRKKKES